jgi:inorganic pyrophosphatase
MMMAEEAPLDTRFWWYVDRLVAESTIVVDRPRGSVHPQYSELKYPLDYGFLESTSAGDGHGIDVWCGSLEGIRVTGAIVTVDLTKSDSEVKLLVGCTAEEAELALAMHQTGAQAAILLSRPSQREEAFSPILQEVPFYDVEVQQLEPQLVAGIRAITTQDGIASTFASLLPEITEYLKEHEVSSTGAPYVRYFHVGADRVDMEVGMTVAGSVEGNARIELGELPGGAVATTTHTGPYEGLADAYAALVEWIRGQGRQETGTPWEVYASHPGEDPDFGAGETRIFWPIL